MMNGPSRRSAGGNSGRLAGRNGLGAQPRVSPSTSSGKSHGPPSAGFRSRAGARRCQVNSCATASVPVMNPSCTGSGGGGAEPFSHEFLVGAEQEPLRGRGHRPVEPLAVPRRGCDVLDFGDPPTGPDHGDPTLPPWGDGEGMRRPEGDSNPSLASGAVPERGVPEVIR